MALSLVSLTLKQSLCQNDEKTDMVHAWSLFLWRVWKEVCRRCGCLPDDGKHFQHLLH
jgi:hypothetical protein